MEEIIPKRLLKKLETGKWYVIVKTSVDNIIPYLKSDQTFFPEYTDHGLPHTKGVLENCDRLLTNEALQKMSIKDVAILILSAFVHDIGMFIKKDGLTKILFDEDYNKRLSEGLDSLCWAQLWDHYKDDIKRYSDRKLTKLFGSPTPINVIEKDPNNFKNVDILAYGEFLRQYHHRLSYEIVMNGFVGYEDLDILRNTDINEKYREIIAIIARSHGMELRECQKYMVSKLNKTFCGVHVYFLMVLLRMADYIDAGRHRVSDELSAAQLRLSPLSNDEHKWNRSITGIDFLPKEELYIYADPKDSFEFIKIENWIIGMQRELDTSWAFLGEQHEETIYRELSLSIRRIQSEILENNVRERYDRRFVTEGACFSANQDLLSLLIQPLYDNRPTYGIRELLQNSIDACNERALIEGERGNKGYKGQIKVSLNWNDHKICIKDNGTGMDKNIILNYFLTSGASFRDSPEWKKEFTTVDQKSKVKRIGRFGVGVLAAYLLGNQITVKTRHIKEDLGYCFSARLNDDHINIDRCEMRDIGTEIWVNTNKRTIENLSMPARLRHLYSHHNQYFDCPTYDMWHVSDEPIVEYIEDGYVKRGASDAINLSDMHKVDSNVYDDFRFVYSDNIPRGLYYNGIFVQDPMNDMESVLRVPSIFISDKQNRICLDLARKKIIDKIPDLQLLYIECTKYLVAKALTFDFSSNELMFRVEGSSRPVAVVLSKRGFLFYDSVFEYIVDTNIIFAVIKEGKLPEPDVISKLEYATIISPEEDVGEAIKRKASEVARREKNYDMGPISDIFKLFPSSNTIKIFRPHCYTHSIIVETVKKYLLNGISEGFDKNPWIPFDMDERKKKFAMAFDDLKCYM